MKLKRLREDDVQINLISLIDVLLFLVIFFMVSTTFVAKSQLSLNLPEAATNEENNRKKAIEVTLARLSRFAPVFGLRRRVSTWILSVGVQ